MPHPRVLILRAPGHQLRRGNCACLLRSPADGPTRCTSTACSNSQALYGQYQILCIPGGFSFGDDIASGRILANLIRHHLADAMRDFKAAGKLILGICNGFQVLIKSGILLDDDPQHGPPATLAWNASGRFEDRWVHLNVEVSKCVFLAGIESMYLPVAHGEGRFVARSPQVIDELQQVGQLVLRYGPDGDRVAGAGPKASPGLRGHRLFPIPTTPTAPMAMWPASAMRRATFSASCRTRNATSIPPNTRAGPAAKPRPPATASASSRTRSHTFVSTWFRYCEADGPGDLRLPPCGRCI